MSLRQDWVAGSDRFAEAKDRRRALDVGTASEHSSKEVIDLLTGQGVQ